MPPAPELKSLNLRAFSPPLLRQIKATAALQGKTMRGWVIEAIEEKLAGRTHGEERRTEPELQKGFDSENVQVYGDQSSRYAVEFRSLRAYEVRALAQIFRRMKFILEDR